jgi:hypothetical protein
LVSKRKSRDTVSVQVKFSKDYLATHQSMEEEIFQKNFCGSGWWTINRDKVRTANLWLFVLFGFEGRSTDYILIPPDELLERLESKPQAHSHLCVTNSDECWEIRNLPKEQRRQIARGNYRGPDRRNFTKWLNNWNPLEKLNSR